MGAADLLPVVPQIEQMAGQLDPVPVGSSRPALNDGLASHPRPPAEVALWPTFDGSHGTIPDGTTLDAGHMDPYPIYSPSLAGVQPVSDFWDHPCECPQ